METKLGSIRLEIIKQRLGFPNCFAINSIGRKGGQALLWRDNFKLIVNNYSQMHIPAWVEDKDNHTKWLLSGFYGEPASNRRNHTWSLLDAMKTVNLSPWMIVGDFNGIILQSKK